MLHEATASHPKDRRPRIQRLWFVADATVADVKELPHAVRAVIDAAAEVHVVTPTLPGRVAWLADDIDRHRHLADERLDTVLGHLHAIDVYADGMAGRGSVLTPIEDAVADFRPDHMLLALHSSRHAYWQERRLIEHIEQHFGVPLSTYAVDSKATLPPPTAHCCSATTDQTTPDTRSAQASCSTVATRWS